MSGKREADHEDEGPDIKRIKLSTLKDHPDVLMKAAETMTDVIMDYVKEKETEVMSAQDTLHKARHLLHCLRYAVVSSYYGDKSIPSQQKEQSLGDLRKQTLHPAVKKLVGKNPEPTVLESLSRPRFLRRKSSRNAEKVASNSTSEPVGKVALKEDYSKMPQYVPPLSTNKPTVSVLASTARMDRYKIKKKLIVGNVSKYIPENLREDKSTHKWMLYVRTPKEEADIATFVSSVRFFLHPTYKPHDIIDVHGPLFRVTRRGWGEFLARIQVNFILPQNRPIEISHRLVLDQTHTGLQTLGAEQTVDVWLFSNEDNNTVEHEMSPATASSASNCDKPDEGQSQLLPSVLNGAHSSLQQKCIKKHDKSKIEKNSETDKNGMNKENDKDTSMTLTNEPAILVYEDGEHKTFAHGPLSPTPEHKRATSEKVEATQDQNKKHTSCYSNRICTPTIIDHDYLGCIPGFDFMPPKSQTSIVQCMGKNGVTFYVSVSKPHSRVLAGTTISGIVNHKNNGATKMRSLLMKPLDELQATSLLKNNMHLAPSTKAPLLIVKNGGLLAKKSQSVVQKRSLLRKQVAGPAIMKNRASPKVNSPANILALRCLQMEETYQEEQRLKMVETMVKQLQDDRIAVMWLMRNYPVVDKRASNPDFKRVHPYCSESMDVYMKRTFYQHRAAELMRVKAVQRALQRIGSPAASWSARHLSIWARQHALTPPPPSRKADEQEDLTPFVKVAAVPCLPTWDDAEEVKQWLESKGNLEDATEDEDLDITSVDSTPPKAKKEIKEENVSRGGKLPIVCGLPPAELHLSSFIEETNREIGIRLQPENILSELSAEEHQYEKQTGEHLPTILYPAAQHVISQALQSFMEDLLRRSFSALERRRNDETPTLPDAVMPLDIREAILSRPEFDLFTNFGLGVKSTDAS